MGSRTEQRAQDHSRSTPSPPRAGRQVKELFGLEQAHQRTPKSPNLSKTGAQKDFDWTQAGFSERSAGCCFMPPPADKETFKDLLIFEERLKQNAARLQSQRLKYEVFLLSMVVVTILLTYKTLLNRSPYQIIHYAYVGLLLVSVMTLILFFATGMYTDRILYAYKFIPQTNRALRPFNMFLNTPYRPSWSMAIINLISAILRFNFFFLWRSKPSGNPSSQFLRPQSPPAHQHTLVNPRGEILFSSRVSSEFVDRYESYRTQWELRQKK